MDHLAGLREQAARFLEVAAAADAAAPVPSCPGWDVADLVFHLGSVWDRFATIVAGRLTEKDQIRALTWPDRPAADVVAWAAHRRDRLVSALADLGPDEPVWNFTRAPHVGAWVPRRMHHETRIHRWDLEQAVGGAPAPIAPEVAADGLDELLTVLSTAGKRWDGDADVVLAVRTTSPDGAWSVWLAPGERAVDGTSADGTSADADVTVAGPAPDVLLAAWGRRPLSTVEVAGDVELAGRALATIGR